MNPLHPNLHEYLAYRFKKYQKRTFIRFGKQKISYKAAYQELLKIAVYLQKLKLTRDFKVGILAKNRPEMILVYFGAVLGGANIVPLNFFLSKEEIDFIAANCDMQILFYAREYQSIVDYLKKQNKKIQTYICLDEPCQGDELTYAAAIGSLCTAEYQPLNFKSHDVSTVLYTSGTTGNPKGVELTHENLICDAVFLADHYFVHQPARIRYCAFLPLFHSFSFMVAAVCMIELGATVSLIETIMPFKTVLKTIIKHRINILVGIPQVFRVLSEIKIPGCLKPLVKLLFPIKSCISGGAPLSVAVLENFEKKFGVPIYQGYGLTEASPVVCVNIKVKNKKGSVGLIPPGMLEAKIVDENGHELENIQAGELVIKGKTVMKGYYNNPEETAKTLKNGWLYTGDVAIIDSEGFITIVDRKKDVIIANGMNIYPADIEQLLKNHPAVREVCVFGVPDTHHGEIPIAYVERYPDKPVTALELKKFLMKHEAAYKIPKQFIFTEQIPRDSTGKIVKREIRKAYLENRS